MEARLINNRKLLGEFLLEQQEPFALEAFLLERGCSRSLFIKRSSSSSSSSSGWGRRKGLLHFSKLLRAIQHQIGFFNGSFLRSKHGMVRERTANRSSSMSFSTSWSRSVLEGDGLSSPSNTTAYISCNENSDTEENPESQNQDGYEAEDIRDTVQEDEHSVFSSDDLQEPPSCEAGLPVKPAAEDPAVSASLQEVLVHCLNQQVGPLSSEYSDSKKGAQKTKRLLLDCVAEAIETHERKEKAKGWRERSLSDASEQIGKLICQRVMEWGMASRKGTSGITGMVYDHLLGMEEEGSWGDSEAQKMEISTGIADGILGDIRDEILANMM
ncbi:hypothetical protein MLD38_022370 [Melastoma candidum]|uniref:Uncharacterized protein n=1 Tax=Melastoma candidum TaxID=119954 RepID=A0ACB9QMX7_9MYRT|nr:hypothetical protein MLD38_022370 [Melastoma candidum]